MATLLILDSSDATTHIYTYIYTTIWSATQTRATYGGLCGMPACEQAVGCGVCDTPELWCGAAGLCACTRVCWYRRIFTYIHTQNTYSCHSIHSTPGPRRTHRPWDAETCFSFPGFATRRMAEVILYCILLLLLVLLIYRYSCHIFSTCAETKALPFGCRNLFFFPNI